MNMPLIGIVDLSPIKSASPSAAIPENNMKTKSPEELDILEQILDVQLKVRALSGTVEPPPLRITMTDLQITRLCAEAMGYIAKPQQTPSDIILFVTIPRTHSMLPDSVERYDPLHDDAQAMALVKKLGLSIRNYIDRWRVSEIGGDDIHQDEDGVNTDLNRAICECVANMQKAHHD